MKVKRLTVLTDIHVLYGYDLSSFYVPTFKYTSESSLTNEAFLDILINNVGGIERTTFGVKVKSFPISEEQHIIVKQLQS